MQFFSFYEVSVHGMFRVSRKWLQHLLYSYVGYEVIHSLIEYLLNTSVCQVLCSRCEDIEMETWFHSQVT